MRPITTTISGVVALLLLATVARGGNRTEYHCGNDTITVVCPDVDLATLQKTIVEQVVAEFREKCGEKPPPPDVVCKGPTEFQPCRLRANGTTHCKGNRRWVAVP